MAKKSKPSKAFSKSYGLAKSHGATARGARKAGSWAAREAAGTAPANGRTYGAWNAGLPCKNPSCKSHGKPHPNCRCYGNFAKGGEVSFCSENRPHNPDCEYYADGGDVFAPPTQDELGAAEPSAPSATPDLTSPPTSDELSASEGDMFAPPTQDEIGGDADKYGTAGQQALTIAEGVAQGVAGPLATAAELGLSKLGVPGISAEDIAGRQATNPWEHGVSEAVGLGGSMLMGTGEAGLAMKAAEEAAEFANLGKVGSGIIKGAISNGLIQGGDEVSKWMLGQGNPQDPVGAALAHMGAAGLFGGAAGMVGGLVGKSASAAMQTADDIKLGGQTVSQAAGFGAAAKYAGNPEELENFNKVMAKQYSEKIGPAGSSFEDYMKGQTAYNNFVGQGKNKLIDKAGEYLGASIGGAPGMIMGGMAGKALEKPIGFVLNKVAGPARKYVTPLMMKIIESNKFNGIAQTINHVNGMSAGYESMSNLVDSLIKGGSNAAISAYGSAKARGELDNYIGNGGINQNIQQQIYKENQSPQGYAKGGMVKEAETPKAVEPILKENDGVEAHYPEQSMLMNAAKGRVSNYLASLRPSDNTPRLAFDKQPDNKAAARTYNRALDLANCPLGIVKELKDGTISPEHIKHFTSMYPEVNGLLQKKMTEMICQAQLDGDKPNFKIRQGMSLLMGTALSSEFTPQNIMAAQSVFQDAPSASSGQPAQGQSGQGGPSKNKASLSKSDQAYLTGGQALQRRSQRSS